MRFARHALAIAALLAAAAIAWPRVAYWQQSRLADRLAVEILAGDASQCQPAIDQLAGLDLPAIEPLVFLAACGTPQIATAAQEAVLDFATTWEIDFQSHGDAAQFAERLIVLAGAIELHASRFDAEAWPWQQRLARRIIADCEAVPASQSLAILRSCDRALATVRPPASAAETDMATLPIVPPSLLTGQAASPFVDIYTVGDEEIRPKTPPPTGDLVLPSKESLNSLRGIPGTADHYAPPPNAAPASAIPLPAPAKDSSNPPVVEVPSPAETEALLRSLRRQPDRALLDKLKAESRFEAAVIRQALQRRGYSAGLLDAITRLQRAAVDERRHALENINALPSTDAQRVLRWFVDDPEPTLRLKALAILATSGDPRLAEIARQRALQDADPRVAALATRLMNETK
jgi:hypothetical protein